MVFSMGQATTTNMRNMANGFASEGDGGNSTPNFLVLLNDLKALVVDYDYTSRTLHRRLLRLLGIDAQVAESGRGAVELCRSGVVFNLIIIELRMPGMNGLETTRALRTMGVRSKIIGLSAEYDAREREAFRAAGADEYYEKPLRNADLLPILREIDLVIDRN